MITPEVATNPLLLKTCN